MDERTRETRGGTARADQTRMARFLRPAVAALSAALLSTIAGSARADAAAGASAPVFVGCQVAIGANGMSLPANAPALLVEDRSNGATPTISAELVSADGRASFGAPTKDAHGLTIVALPKSSVGQHTIETKVVCSNGSPDALQETTLALTAPVDFPTSVGTIKVRPNPTPTGSETIELEASPGLRAFKSIAVVELLVNGAHPTATFPGLAEVPAFSVPTGNVCVENGALHREKRTIKVTVSARLAGVAESPAPATLDLVVDCGAIHWTTDADFDGSKSSGTPTTSDPNAPSGGQSSSASGCSAAPVGLLPGSSSVMAAAALALLAGLRRRRAR